MMSPTHHIRHNYAPAVNDALKPFGFIRKGFRWDKEFREVIISVFLQWEPLSEDIELSFSVWIKDFEPFEKANFAPRASQTHILGDFQDGMHGQEFFDFIISRAPHRYDFSWEKEHYSAHAISEAERKLAVECFVSHVPTSEEERVKAFSRLIGGAGVRYLERFMTINQIRRVIKSPIDGITIAVEVARFLGIKVDELNNPSTVFYPLEDFRSWK